ncbi:hypothetical protein ACQ4PT_042419 [Festuca glaucescens]
MQSACRPPLVGIHVSLCLPRSRAPGAFSPPPDSLKPRPAAAEAAPAWSGDLRRGLQPPLPPSSSPSAAPPERGPAQSAANCPQALPLPDSGAEMDVVLQAGDADDWVYKGEGAANLILSYTGSSPSMLGKVLRAKKILNDKAQPAPTCEVFSSSEQLVWGEIPGLVESLKQDCLPQAYAQVMSQHLGANHVDGGVRARVSTEFLEIVGKNVLSSRPAWRVSASAIDTSADSALLISDHSLFSVFS